VRAGYGYEKFTDATYISEIEFDMSVETIRYIVQEGQLLMIPDVWEDKRWMHTSLTKHVRSWVGVPLKVRDQVIGIINLERCVSVGFSDDELELIQIFAVHTSTAIENARLFETLEKRAGELETLRKVNLGLTASLEPDAVIVALVEGIFELMPLVWHANIFLKENDKLTFGTGLWADEVNQLTLLPPRTDGPIYQVAQDGEMNVTPDFPLNQLFDDLGDEEFCGTLISIPLKIGDRVDGVMNLVYADLQPVALTELRVLNLLGDQAALAMENARQYKDVDRLVSLLASEQYRLEGLIEMLPVGVLLLDGEHNLLVSNSLAREFLAVLAPQDTGPNLARLDQFAITEILDRHTDPLPIEIVLDGPPLRIFEIQAQYIATEMPQWVIILRDITQEREVQDRIQMQERLATVGQLAAGIAHDFNNIMAAIVVYADLLLMDKGLSSSSRERLTIIQQQVERAASLIRQILDFSRRSVMEQSSLDVLPLLKEIEKLLSRTLPETVTVELLYQEGEYLLTADPTRLQQVFMNLAVNARDAMPDGGTLSFELSHLHLALSDSPPIPDMPPGAWICIRVRDTGTGIPLEEQSHIFEPFFTTKPVGHGTGLGLAQVYGIIKQHNGYIDFESQVDEGTQFFIYLPALAEPKQETKADEHFSELDGSGRLVLLVEDDPATRKALHAMLSMQNYRVLAAENGAEAFEYLKSNADNIVLVVSDIVMPQMGGFDLYREMQEHWPQIEILFVTGHPLDDQNQQILQDGKVHWLQKPFTVQEFNQTLFELLS
jgi:signal transduction histidine kinase/CheY-like chemotaxis protein